MKLVAFLIAFTPLIFSSCATVSRSSAEDAAAVAQYRLVVKDEPRSHRFALRLESLDERKLYVDIYKWPDALGRLHFGSLWVSLNLNGRIVTAKDENFGYVVGGRSIEIAPRGALVGFVGYEQFGNPRSIANASSRSLRFKVTPSTVRDKF
jgi:hypothetical protein